MGNVADILNSATKMLEHIKNGMFSAQIVLLGIQIALVVILASFGKALYGIKDELNSLNSNITKLKSSIDKEKENTK